MFRRETIKRGFVCLEHEGIVRGQVWRGQLFAATLIEPSAEKGGHYCFAEEVLHADSHYHDTKFVRSFLYNLPFKI